MALQRGAFLRCLVMLARGWVALLHEALACWRVGVSWLGIGGPLACCQLARAPGVKGVHREAQRPEAWRARTINAQPSQLCPPTRVLPDRVPRAGAAAQAAQGCAQEALAGEQQGGGGGVPQAAGVAPQGAAGAQVCVVCGWDCERACVYVGGLALVRVGGWAGALLLALVPQESYWLRAEQQHSASLSRCV